MNEPVPYIMGDYTTVRVTLHTSNECSFLEQLQIQPDERKPLDQPGLVELEFNEWNRPEVEDFFVSSIAFLGFHKRGDEYAPYRFCSDGDETDESICDSQGRLLAPIEAHEGRLTIPELKQVRAYFLFENRCRRLLEHKLEVAV